MIADALKLKPNQDFTIDVAIVSIEFLQLKNKPGEYASISCQDQSGKAFFKVWDNPDAVRNFKVNNIVRLKCSTNEFKGEIQFKVHSALLLEEFPKKITDYLPAYENISQMRSELIEIINSLDDKYNSILNLAFGIEPKDNAVLHAFCATPAASSHHQAKVGGLLLHTLGVTKNVIRWFELYPEITASVDKNRLVFCSLIHDYDKVFEYQNPLKTGLIGYNQDCKLSHIYTIIGSLTEWNIKCGNVFNKTELTEIQRILVCHHGEWDGPKKFKDIDSEILHLADMIDSRTFEWLETVK